MPKINKIREIKFGFKTLEHLGSSMYGDEIGFFCEIISNSWDAEAKNIWITIDEKKNLTIKDDGHGIKKKDFDDKFLTISVDNNEGLKRFSKNLNRPLIGRKGIGRIALFTASDKLTVITKTVDSEEYVAFDFDFKTKNENKTNFKDLFVLNEKIDKEKIDKLKKNFKHGFIAHFENFKIKEKFNLEIIKSLIMLSFRFSMADGKKENKILNIEFNEDLLENKNIDFLYKNKKYVWFLNKKNEEIDKVLELDEKYITILKLPEEYADVRGWIIHKKNVKNDSRLEYEDFDRVNFFSRGRLREKNILKKIDSKQIFESYLYGEIHFNNLENEDYDSTLTSRDGYKKNFTRYTNFLSYFKENVIKKIDRDVRKYKKIEKEITDQKNRNNHGWIEKRKEEISNESYEIAVKEFFPKKPPTDKLKQWFEDIKKTIKNSKIAFQHAYMIENILRRYIKLSVGDKKLSDCAKQKIAEYKKETKNKNMEEKVLEINDYFSLEMSELVCSSNFKDRALYNDYKFNRNLMAHTWPLKKETQIHLFEIQLKINEIINEYFNKEIINSFKKPEKPEKTEKCTDCEKAKKKLNKNL